MNVFELTRALVDIESITGNEERVGNYLFDYLSAIAARHHGRVERMEVEPHRFAMCLDDSAELFGVLGTVRGVAAEDRVTAASVDGVVGQ